MSFEKKEQELHIWTKKILLRNRKWFLPSYSLWSLREVFWFLEVHELCNYQSPSMSLPAFGNSREKLNVFHFQRTTPKIKASTTLTPAGRSTGDSQPMAIPDPFFTRSIPPSLLSIWPKGVSWCQKKRPNPSTSLPSYPIPPNSLHHKTVLLFLLCFVSPFWFFWNSNDSELATNRLF